jgi:hypothetical protein
MKTSADKEHVYGLDCPYDGTSFYKTAAERDAAAKETIQGHLQEREWSEDVTCIYAFTVTHLTKAVDIIHRQGEIDDDGEYWPNADADTMCNYELKPLAEPA